MMKYRVSTHHKDMWFYGKLIYKIKGVNNYEKESIVVFTSRDDTGAESCSWRCGNYTSKQNSSISLRIARRN